MAIKKKQREDEPEQPPQPLVREGGFRSRCHGAECISVPFFVENGAGRRLGTICEVVQCHAYIRNAVNNPDSDDDLETQMRPCLKFQGIIRSNKDKTFGISMKTICAMAEKGVFGIHIKKDTANT